MACAHTDDRGRYVGAPCAGVGPVEQNQPTTAFMSHTSMSLVSVSQR